MSFPSCNPCGPGRTPMGTHTDWRRNTDSESYEELPPAKRQRTTVTQPKGPGSVKDGGHQFEMKMAALIGLRGLQRGDNFELFSNIDCAGNFDDLVYTAGGRRYFLQLKHADNVDRNKLTKEDLVTLLQKCFRSYCAIKYGGTFKDIPIDNSVFIIYTNKELTRELLQHKRRHRTDDIFFKTSEKGEIFSFSPNDENTQIDVYKRLKNSVNQTKEFNDLHEFLNKLIMVTGQKGQRELDKVIIEEIIKNDAANVANEVYKTELLEFKERVEVWCRDTKDKMTATMFRNWLQQAKTASCASLVSTLFVSCAKKLAMTGIEFSDCEISRLRTELFNKRAVHLRSDALTLCSILLLDCLPQSKCIFVNFESLQNNKKKLLHAWLGGHWNWLIVSCVSTVQQSDISDICVNISDVIKPNPSSKRVIILTELSVQKVRNFVSIEHEFRFEQLSQKSQEMVLDKKIDFQGCEVTMRSVLQRHGNVEHVLGPELVTDLITEGNPVNIGGKLSVNTGYYAPRALERRVWLQSNVLRNRYDVFAVIGDIDDVFDIVPRDKTVEFERLENINVTDFKEYMNIRFFLILDEDVENSFLAICEKIEEKPLHCVEFNNGGLLWKMSRGGTDCLLQYVDADKTRADKRIIAERMKSGRCEVNEESIWDLGERTVLVVAEPGMGKTSTTTQVAWHTKERDPTSWVVRINWNDHTRELQGIDAATINLDILLEFFCNAAFPDSKYTDINRSLLKQALQSSGNVTVLMDGFDEICPYYADKAAVILSTLLETKVRRLWVTSRPVVRERLEKELSVIAYDMKKLSRASQKDMVINLWKQKVDEKALRDFRFLAFINDFLRDLNSSFYDVNFTGCPLYIRMIANVCEMEVKTWLNSERRLSPRIDLVKLYEEFVERKLNIYLSEKQKADITNSSVLDNHELLKQTFLLNFENCALAAILPAPMLESLHNKKIEEEIQPFLCKVQAGKDKTGVVVNVVEGKPQFEHRTFAEYFTALWFSKNFESNRSVLEHILFDDKYRFVSDMFDRMLAKDCPLHCAVIDDDRQHFKTLLKEVCDVNSLDKGGRTVMHLIAARDSIFWDIKNLLSHNNFSLYKTDTVLQWTPGQYARKTYNCFFLDYVREDLPLYD